MAEAQVLGDCGGVRSIVVKLKYNTIIGNAIEAFLMALKNDRPQALACVHVFCEGTEDVLSAAYARPCQTA